MELADTRCCNGLLPATTADDQYPDTSDLGAMFGSPSKFRGDDIPESLQVTFYSWAIGKVNQTGFVGKW